MTWEELKTSFSTNIETVYGRAATWLEQAMTHMPDDVKKRVAGTLGALKATGRHLQRAQALLPSRPKTKAEAELVVRYAEMKGLYDAILSGIGLNAVQLEAEPEIEAGFIPASVVLVIGALGLTAAGVAWAIANYEYATALRDQAAFLTKELEARQEAMRSGKDLPAATGYPSGSGENGANKDKKPKDEDKGGWGWLWAVLGIGGLVGAAVYGPKLLKGR